MAESNAYKLETVIIALLNKDATLAAVSPKHKDADTQNVTPKVVVGVVQGETHKEGPEHDSFTATIQIQSNNPAQSTLEDLISRVVSVMKAPNTTGVDLSSFTFIRIEDEVESERTSEPETRATSLQYPIWAKAA